MKNDFSRLNEKHNNELPVLNLLMHNKQNISYRRRNRRKNNNDNHNVNTPFFIYYLSALVAGAWPGECTRREFEDTDKRHPTKLKCDAGKTGR